MKMDNVHPHKIEFNIMREVVKSTMEMERLQKVIEILSSALERIEDTDPDEGTQWFHKVAEKSLDEARKVYEGE